MDLNDRQGSVRGDRDCPDPVEHRADRAHVPLWIDSVFCRILMLSEAETARTVAEKTNDVA